MRTVQARLAFVVVLLAVAVSPGMASAASDDYIVVLKNGVSESKTAEDHAQEGVKVFADYQHAVNGYAATLSKSELAAVRSDSRVDFVAKDRKLTQGFPPQPRPQKVSRGIARIDSELSATRSGDGIGSIPVNVAVIDTGVAAHPDLNLVGGVNCNSGQPTKRHVADVAGHGTVVAGLIGALDNDFGVVGVAPGARIWGVRVFNDNDVGRESAYLCGLDWVTSTRSDKDPWNDIAVANSSLGTQFDEPRDDSNCGRTNHDPEHLAICRSTAAGVTNVVSAGNDAQDVRFGTPAAYGEVLTVTSMTDYDGEPGGQTPGLPPGYCPEFDEVPELLGSDDGASPFSHFATLADDRSHTVSAPGVCVGATFLGGQYAIGSGTSFSTPLVAGTAALCIANAECTGKPKRIIAKLVNDAAAYNQAHPGYGFAGDPLNPIPGKYYGYLIRPGVYTHGRATVRLAGNTLAYNASPGVQDNVKITNPSASTLRVANGSPIHAGARCIQRGPSTVDCQGAIAGIVVTTGDGADQVVNSTAVPSSLFGEEGSDILIGGSYNDRINGGPDPDVMIGNSGNDALLARDQLSDQLINCDGGTGLQGHADRADLDKLPKDPASVVQGCETKTRH